MIKDEALKIIKSAEWLADKIVTQGDYAKEASLRLKQLAQMQREALEQPAQEHVAWYGKDTAFSNENKIFVFNNKDDANAYGLRKSVSIEPLYTHPAPSWQGLSDDEILVIYESMTSKPRIDGYEWDYARAIEAKLKEKNHG